MAVLFDLAGEVNRTQVAEQRGAAEGAGRHLGMLQQRRRGPTCRAGSALDDGAIEALIDAARPPRRRATSPSRPHPRRTRCAGRRAEGLAAGHHLGQGLSAWPHSRAAGRRPVVTPDYWDEACKHLAQRDRVMKKLIPQFGEARLQSRGDAFTTLARSIVGQQISVKAAQSVWDRFGALPARRRTRVEPAAVLGKLASDAARGRPVGAQDRIPARPGAPLRPGTVHVQQWQQMDDEAIIEELVAIRGIGRWTAEMFLIFHLMRPNVLPLDDLGPDQGHQPELLQRRAGVARRGPRGGRRLGAVPVRRHLVHLAQPGPAAASTTELHSAQRRRTA